MIKGGKYLELLARVDVLLLDKTGTLTLGEPQEFQATPGLGVQAKIAGQWVAVGGRGPVAARPGHPGEFVPPVAAIKITALIGWS